MVDSVTLQVVGNTSNRKFTFQTENVKLIKSIVTVKNNTISESDMKKLQETAKKGGDLGILESCDLNAQEKVNLAKLNNFSEYYDIKPSQDGKYLVVTIKKCGMFTQDPTLGTIKSDFGVRDNVFVTKEGIPHGNELIIEKRSKAGSSADGRNTDYDQAKLRPGDVLNIPVSEINISDTPRGFWGRLFQ